MNRKEKMPAGNGRFGATAAVAPQEVLWKPPLRQAAGTMDAVLKLIQS